MESFSDRGILLSMRAHLDKGIVASVLTRAHGRHAGFAYKSAVGTADIGALVDVAWQARVSDQLGLYKTIDVDTATAPLVMHDAVKLVLLQSLCGVADLLLPEREPHADLFEATAAWLEALPDIDDPLIAGAGYVMWEILLLRALGYGLDLSRCAASGVTHDLVYVSPKTGKAVCEMEGRPYAGKMLLLPPFLRPDGRGEALTGDHIRQGLTLTQTFFEKWVLAHMTAHLPALRYDVHKHFV